MAREERETEQIQQMFSLDKEQTEPFTLIINGDLSPWWVM